MSDKTFYCLDCDYVSPTSYHYNRHIMTNLHKKKLEYRMLYGTMHHNTCLCNHNIKNLIALNKLNNVEFKNYNDWININLQADDVEEIKFLSFANNNFNTILSDSSPLIMKNKLNPIACPWCQEYYCIKGLLDNNNIDTLKILPNDCAEHMKSCEHKLHHEIIEKNLSASFTQALEIIAVMVENFKVMSKNYDALKKQNEEALQIKNNFDKLEIKFQKLKDQCKTLQEENTRLKYIEARYDELQKINTIKQNKNDTEKIHYTINSNGNNANINLMTYICNHCKDALPIDSIDNRKMIEHKYIMDYIEPKKIEEDNNATKEVDVTQQIPKEINMNNFELEKMLIRGYNNNNNAYYKFIADFIIKFHKNPDTSKQPMWSTDITRYSYIIKTLKNGWVKDKNGIQVMDKCIKPLIQAVSGLLNAYIEYLDKKTLTLKKEFKEQTKNHCVTVKKGKDLNKYNFKSYASCVTYNETNNYVANTKMEKSLSVINLEVVNLLNLLRCIADDKFTNKVIKVITPHFAVDKCKLMETTENLKEITQNLKEATAVN
jgi:hypothetical protein